MSQAFSSPTTVRRHPPFPLACSELAIEPISAGLLPEARQNLYSVIIMQVDKRIEIGIPSPHLFVC